MTDVHCGECGHTMVLRDSKYGKFWGCSMFPKCRGAHGARPDAVARLGVPADKATKLARIEAHDAFDELWRNGPMPSRRAAYNWLRQHPSLPNHIGQMTEAECRRLVQLTKRWI